MFFNGDFSGRASELKETGFVHLKECLPDDAIAYLEKFYVGCEEGQQEDLAGGYIKGKKKQFLFDFPDIETRDAFRDKICGLVGYEPGALTVSERHIKAYDQHAKDLPSPHKDRNASTFSIGIPIRLSEGTSVCMFPQLDRSPNAHDKAQFLADKTEDQIGALYADDKTVHLNEEVGDIVVFEGSALYHERARPAGSVVLYIKINDQGMDPLGENLFVGE